MSAMEWVRLLQVEEGTAQDWDLDESISQVRSSLTDTRSDRWSSGFYGALLKSRAVKVSSTYSQVVKIPNIFAHVLVGGAMAGFKLENLERKLSIAGLLAPMRKQGNEEFIEYDWTDTKTLYGVSNSLMAEYYYDEMSHVKHLKSGLRNGMFTPESCADLLARALPYMTLESVVDTCLWDEKAT